MRRLILETLNENIIKNIPETIETIEINNKYVLTKNDYNNLIIYTNVNNIYVYDVETFNYDNTIKINVTNNITFKTPKYKKIKINKIDGYQKENITINLPFKLTFEDEYLYNEEDDFNTLINYTKKIKILNINIEETNTIEKIFEIVYKIEEKTNNKIQFINLITQNKTIKEIEKLKLLEDDRIIKIWYEDGITDCTIDEFIIMRKNLDKIINEINTKKLSNFEKIIYAYDIVKKFNYTPSNNQYSMDGRHLHKIFKTKNIVCAGFSRIITQVLNELGIKSSIYKLITKDNILHARSLVHIKDEKYNINTICSMEPTWESTINEKYAYSLFLTPINKIKESFPKEKFYEDIEVLTKNKTINEIPLKDRISLYKLFDNNDLTQNIIEETLNNCNENINLSSFINALITVKCSQGISKNIVVSNIKNIIKYNDELTKYINNKMETNIRFFNM